MTGKTLNPSSIATTCPYCGVGCGVRVTARSNGVSVAGDVEHPANVGRLCSKGSQLGATLRDKPRLLAPQIAGRKVSWGEATDHVAEKIAHSIAQYGPDSVAFYLSGQILTEDYYVANKLMKGFIGSANVDTNSRLCMSSAVAAYKRAFGSDTVPLGYEDIERTELMVLVGSNAAWTHPVLFQRMQQAREQQTNYRIVVIDPKASVSARAADLHLAIKPGTDAMLFNGLLRYLYQREQIDRRFIAEQTEGFEKALSHCPETLDEVALYCALPLEQLQRFYQWFAESNAAITFYSMGINQSNSGTDKCNAIINVHLATGKIGKEGSGPFSITGQPNAMGGREVGGLANMLAAHMDFVPADVDRVKRFWGAPKIASSPGLKAVDMFQAIAEDKIKVLWIMGTNPAVSMPDSNRIKQLLQRCPTLIVSDCMEKTDTTELADVLLPATTWGERDGTVTNSERRISRQRPFKAAPELARHDWWIVCEVAKKLGFADAFAYTHASDIFVEHARLSGFENNGTRDFDISALAALKRTQYDTLSPVQWPLRKGETTGPARLFADGRFFTASGRAQFISVAPVLPELSTDPACSLLLNTGRNRDQWHTMTRTAQAAKLNQHKSLPLLELCAQDMARLQLRDGDLVQLNNEYGHYIGIAQLSDRQLPGQCFAAIHWTEQFSRNSLTNALLPAITDPVSGQPQLKQARVQLKRLAVGAWRLQLTEHAQTALSAALFQVSLPLARGFLTLSAYEQPPSALALITEPGAEPVALTLNTPALKRQVIVHEQRLVGLEQLSTTSPIEQIAGFCDLFAQARVVEAQLSPLLSAQPVAKGIAVCACFGTCSGQIIDYCAAHPAATLAEIERELRCGSNCGSCRSEVAEIFHATAR